MEAINSKMAKIESKSRVICNKYDASVKKMEIAQCVAAIEAAIKKLDSKSEDYAQKLDEYSRWP